MIIVYRNVESLRSCLYFGLYHLFAICVEYCKNVSQEHIRANFCPDLH